MKIKPLADNIVVKMQEAEETTKGGLLLVASAKEKPQIAEVIAVGPGEVNTISGIKTQMTVKEGQKVIISKYSGTELKTEDGDFIIVKMSDVLAITE